MILASIGAIDVPDRHCKVFTCDRWGWGRSPLQGNKQPSALALNFLSQKIRWYLVVTYYNKLSHNCFNSGRSQFDTALVAVIKKAEMIGGDGNGVFLPQNNQSSSMKDVTIPRLIVATEETEMAFSYRKILNFHARDM